MRLRTGPELVVIDVSDAGALVEGTVRLLPGARLDVHVIASHGRVLVRSRVARAFVSSVRADAIRYRGALVFDEPVATAMRGYLLPDQLTAMAPDPGSAYPAFSGGEPPAP